MNHPPVVMVSLWRNDTARRLTERAEHLLAKTYPRLRWVWVVGDSTDATWLRLHQVQARHRRANVDVLDIGDTGHPGTDPNARMRRLSAAVSAGLERVRPRDHYVLCHESDIVSPEDVVERLVDLAESKGQAVVGGWPMLGDLMYDCWAYRSQGKHLSNHTPRPAAPFELDSIGTVYLMPAWPFHDGLRCQRNGAVELCQAMRQRGYKVWCDPSITVTQPMDLWQPWGFPSEVAV